MRDALLALAARIGMWWHALPALIVVGFGLATCHLIETPDPDRYVVDRSIVQGSRAAVVLRHKHADSGTTVQCIWLVAAPPPSAGPTRRIAETCALVAVDGEADLQVRWGQGGRLLVRLPAGAEAVASEPPHARCYYEAASARTRVCYMPQSIQIETR
jgi:hypothetical protein